LYIYKYVSIKIYLISLSESRKFLKKIQGLAFQAKTEEKETNRDRKGGCPREAPGAFKNA
jgi:hypothetical protein